MLYMQEYTLAEVHLMIEQQLADGNVDWSDRQSNQEMREAFHGGFTLEDAGQAMITGWDAHREEMGDEIDRVVNELREEVNDYLGTHHREVRDVSGGFVDIDRFLMGDPECMVESWLDEDVLQGKALKVLVNITANANVSDEALIKRGGAVIAAVEAVLASGMNVELWVGECCRPTGSGSSADRNVELVCLKEYNDFTDPDVLAYCLAHPSYLRRIVFFLNEQHPEDVRRKFGFNEHGGYGSAQNFPDEVAEQFDLVIERYQHGDETDPARLYEEMMRIKDRASEYA